VRACRVVQLSCRAGWFDDALCGGEDSRTSRRQLAAFWAIHQSEGNRDLPVFPPRSGWFLGRPYTVWRAALQHSGRFPYSD
jgi:hypothetical protein